MNLHVIYYNGTLCKSVSLFSLFCVIFGGTLFKNRYSFIIMPSQKPRINLTVPPHIDTLLERLSDLTGSPKTKLIIEMLEQYSPVLSSVVDALEQVNADKENGKEIVKNFAKNMLLDANIKLGEVAKEASQL